MSPPCEKRERMSVNPTYATAMGCAYAYLAVVLAPCFQCLTAQQMPQPGRMAQQTDNEQGSYLEPVEHDELDVVVGLRRQQLAVAVGGGPARAMGHASATVLTLAVGLVSAQLHSRVTT